MASSKAASLAKWCWRVSSVNQTWRMGWGHGLYRQQAGSYKGRATVARNFQRYRFRCAKTPA